MKAPVLSADEVIQFVSKWTIGSTGAHTKTTGFPGTGFTGIARTAAGKYTITFAPGAPALGGLLELRLSHWPAEDAASLNLEPRVSTYTPEVEGTSATVKYEAWDNDTTAQTELTSGDHVTVVAVFQKTIGT